jgi:hypothetical protein
MKSTYGGCALLIQNFEKRILKEVFSSLLFLFPRKLEVTVLPLSQECLIILLIIKTVKFLSGQHKYKTVSKIVVPVFLIVTVMRLGVFCLDIITYCILTL